MSIRDIMIVKTCTLTRKIYQTTDISSSVVEACKLELSKFSQGWTSSSGSE